MYQAHNVRSYVGSFLLFCERSAKREMWHKLLHDDRIWLRETWLSPCSIKLWRCCVTTVCVGTRRFCWKSQLFLYVMNKIYLPCRCVLFVVVCQLLRPIKGDFRVRIKIKKIQYNSLHYVLGRPALLSVLFFTSFASYLTSCFSFYCRPRLGTTLHRVLGVGALYFILATIEGCFRSLHVSLFLCTPVVAGLNSKLGD